MRAGAWFVLPLVLSAAPLCRAADDPEFGGKPLSQWVKLLNDHKVRAQAIDAIGSIGPDAKSAAPRLAQLLRHKVGVDRSEVLRKKKEEDDKKEAERKKAAEAAAAGTSATKKPQPKMPVKNPADVKIEQETKKRLEAEHQAFLDSAAGIDVKIVAAVLVKLAAKDETAAKPAVTELANAVDVYDDLGGGAFAGNATECVKALGQFGPFAKPVLSQLVKLMAGAKAPDLAEAAAAAAAKIAPDSPDVLRVLIKKAQDRDEKIAVPAMATLKGIGKPAKEAVPVLKQIRDKAGAMSKLGKAADEALTAIGE